MTEKRRVLVSAVGVKCHRLKIVAGRAGRAGATHDIPFINEPVSFNHAKYHSRISSMSVKKKEGNGAK